MRTPLAWSSLALCFVVCVGCTRTVRPGPTLPAGPVPEAEADSQSGPEGLLQGAVPMYSHSDDSGDMDFAVFDGDGEVSWPARKRTRWLRAEVSSSPADANTPLRCELSYKPHSAELQIDAWSAAQKQLPEHHQIAPGLYVTEVFLEKPAPVYLRVRAMHPDDAARFTLQCTWQTSFESPRRRRGGRGGYRPRPDPEPWERFERGTEGRIISSTKVDGRMVLRIDKGETAGVKVGSEGGVLAGKSGREPLDGGSFKVVAVSEKECTAESQVRSIGRNLRVVLFLN